MPETGNLHLGYWGSLPRRLNDTTSATATLAAEVMGLTTIKEQPVTP